MRPPLRCSCCGSPYPSEPHVEACEYLRGMRLAGRDVFSKDGQAIGFVGAPVPPVVKAPVLKFQSPLFQRFSTASLLEMRERLDRIQGNGSTR